MALLVTSALAGCGDDPPPPHPVEDAETGDASYAAGEGEEVIRDTAYIVVEKRQAGGDLVPDSDAVSELDGRPRMNRQPLEHMIIVRGDKTGQESAYLLPQSDFNIVQEGQGLQESTLSRWESTAVDHIPPPPAPAEGEESDRSRAGGADGNIVY